MQAQTPVYTCPCSLYMAILCHEIAATRTGISTRHETGRHTDGAMAVPMTGFTGVTACFCVLKCRRPVLRNKNIFMKTV